MSKAEARKKSNDDLHNGKLLNEIEAISKALYLDKNPSKISSSVPRNRPKSVDKANILVPDLKSKHCSNDPSAKEKKSFWNWKPLKALSHVKNRRFDCCFTLEVHSIEGLPSEFNDLILCVHWKRRDGEVVTSPIKVIKGIAKFEQKLTHTCSVLGSRNGPHHSAKYEAKHFLLYAVVHGNPKLDLGKHRVDLTRLLPLTLEELEDEKSSGTWTTTFKLSGKARGALMNVSFGYQVLGDCLAPSNKNVLQVIESKSSARTCVKYNLGHEKGSVRRAESLPTNHKSSVISRSGEDKEVLHEVLPARVSEFSNSVDMLYQKFDEEKSDTLLDSKCENDVSVVDVEPAKPLSCSPSDSSNANIVNETEDSLAFEKRMEYSEEKLQLNEDTAEIDEPPVRSVDQPDLHVGCSGQDIIQERSFIADKTGIHDHNSQEKDTCTKESLLEDLESVLNRVANLEKEVLDTPEANSELSYQESRVEDKPNGSTKSHNLDDLADSVADEFLSMLEIEDSPFSLGLDKEPESPRERLLREFQKEAEASGCSLFGFDIDEVDVADYDDYTPIISGWEEFTEGSEFLPDGEMQRPGVRAKEMEELEPPALAIELDERTFGTSWSSDLVPVGELQDAKIRAKMLEDLETQALMEDWGLNEKAFRSSPPYNRSGVGSPSDLLPKEPVELPPLAEGLGSTIQTKTGGFLRSMNPVHFRNAKSGGSLAMQVSSPVVVPAELGSGVTEILQNLAAVGLEKLSMQTKKLMPLEDVTGRTIQQIVWERQTLLQDKTANGQVATSGQKRVKGASASRKSKKSTSSCAVDGVDSEYISLEDLAPLAMDKIEALSIEGLRMQSGMSDEEALSNISAQSIGEFSAVEGKQPCSSVSLGMEGAAGLQLLEIKDNGTDDIDGLMGLSLTLDEWMKLDSGEIDEEEMSERTSKLLAAHHANCRDLDFLRNKGERKQGKASGKHCGILGNNFTVALMVQLRDPFRDFEPVGMPMLALIQVERVFVPPKPKIYSTVAEAREADGGENELDAAANEQTKKVERKEEKPEVEDLNPQYKISEVYVAGLKTEPGKKKLWGNTAQQQSGSRWLLANGMGKSNKLPLGRSKAASKSSLSATVKSQPGDKLWSISARSHGTGAKWK